EGGGDDIADAEQSVAERQREKRPPPDKRRLRPGRAAPSATRQKGSDREKGERGKGSRDEPVQPPTRQSCRMQRGKPEHQQGRQRDPRAHAGKKDDGNAPVARRKPMRQDDGRGEDHAE